MNTMRRILVLALAVGDIAAAAYLVPRWWHAGLLETVRTGGWMGALVYATVCCAATVLMVPPSAWNAGAGMMFGTIKGTLLVYPALVVASMVSFWMSRSLARDWFARHVARSPKFVAIERAVEKGGWRIVLLLRMSPVSPLPLLSYSLGLTRVRLQDYVVGTVVGALPGTTAYVYIGEAMNQLHGASDTASALHRALFWIGLAATIGAFVMITRRARQELRRITGEPMAAAQRAT